MKLVDILNEVEQNEVVTEVVTPQVDEIGKFFVVTKPIGKMDDVDDLIKELTITELMSLSIEAKDILGIFKDKLGAKRAGSGAPGPRSCDYWDHGRVTWRKGEYLACSRSSVRTASDIVNPFSTEGSGRSPSIG